MPAASIQIPLIDSMRQLEVLRIRDTAITDQDIAGLRDLEKLRVLDFSDTSITSEGLRRLNRNVHLEELSLARCSRFRCRTGFNLLISVPRYPRSFSNNTITDEGIVAIGTPPSLEDAVPEFDRCIRHC